LHIGPAGPTLKVVPDAANDALHLVHTKHAALQGKSKSKRKRKRKRRK